MSVYLPLCVEHIVMYLFCAVTNIYVYNDFMYINVKQNHDTENKLFLIVR